MAVQTKGRRRDGEETPLLTGQRCEDAEREENSVLAPGEVVDINKANQQVGRGRGFLIILSLYGLIFLQGSLLTIPFDSAVL